MSTIVWYVLYALAGAILVAWPFAIVWFGTLKRHSLGESLTWVSIWPAGFAMVVFAHHFRSFQAFLTFEVGLGLLWVLLYFIARRVFRAQIAAYRASLKHDP